MIRRHRAELSGELGSSVGLELISVKLDTKSGGLSVIDNRARFFDSENPGLTEDVCKALAFP